MRMDVRRDGIENFREHFAIWSVIDPVEAHGHNQGQGLRSVTLGHRNYRGPVRTEIYRENSSIRILPLKVTQGHSRSSLPTRICLKGYLRLPISGLQLPWSYLVAKPTTISLRPKSQKNFILSIFTTRVRRLILGILGSQPKKTRRTVAPSGGKVNTVSFPGDREHDRQVRNEWRQFCSRKSVPPDPFQVAQLDVVLKNMKSGTTAGYDNILPEFLKRIGPRAKNCLASFFNVQEKKITRASYLVRQRSQLFLSQAKTIPLLPAIVQSHYCLCAPKSWRRHSVVW